MTLFLQELFKLTQERDYFKAEVEGKKGAINPPPSLERYHLSRELKDCNAQIAKLQEEVYDESTFSLNYVKFDFIHFILENGNSISIFEI